MSVATMEKEINFGINPIFEFNDLLGDDIAYIKQYDFSTANNSLAHRVHAVSSICYANNKTIKSNCLFTKIAAESAGIPSSFFEYIPVLFNELDYSIKLHKLGLEKSGLATCKYSSLVKSAEGIAYRLTNYRAVMSDFENTRGVVDYTNHFNDDNYELKIIKENFDVFLLKVDLLTKNEIVDNRIMRWQELSRRYSNDNKIEHEFYIEDKMKEVKSSYPDKTGISNAFYVCDRTQELEFSTNDIIGVCLNHYLESLESGVAPQIARSILPQSAYTNLWINLNSEAMKSFLKSKVESSTQWEVKQVMSIISEITSILLEGEIRVGVIDDGRYGTDE